MRLHTLGIGLVALAIVAAGTPAQLAAEQPDKAADILAQARKAIGAGKLESLKTFSAEGRTQRNVGAMQLNAEVELLLALPDKYLRSESSAGGPVNFSSTSGFNGDRPLARTGTGAHGGMVVVMGPGGAAPGQTPTPEQQAEMDRVALRVARQDASRLMLGWFGMAHPALDVTYTYAGEAESPDGKADVIDAKGADGFNARLFIDQQTHLPLMLTYQGPQRRVMTAGSPMAFTSAGGAQVQSSSRPMSDEDRKKMNDGVQKQMEQMRNEPPAMVEYRMFFADWTDVDGIKLPMKLQRATVGTTDEEWTITKVKVNPKIDLKRFESQS